MRHLPLTISVIALTAGVGIAFARDYDMSHLPYSDAPSDRPTAVAVSALTEAGVLQGDPSGTFRPDSELNRAEFMKIAMTLLPSSASETAYSRTCFPDVPQGEWYAPFVCRAKALGIVNGNGKAGLPPEQWPFEPIRPVLYAEVLKVLTNIFAIPTVQTEGEWYTPYWNVAVNNDLGIAGLMPGDKIRRGEMARVVAAFLAYSEGELDKLRAAQQEPESSSSLSSSSGSSLSSSSRSSTSSSRSSSSSNSSRSLSASSWTGGYDPLTDTAIRSNFLLLGTTSPILGSINLYSNNEPIDMTKLTITLSSAVPAIDTLLIYDHDRRFLGQAALDSNDGTHKQYVANITSQALTLPRRENMLIYVRARVKAKDAGGESGESVQLSSFLMQGTGQWSTDAYNQTFTDTFPLFVTSRSRITSIANAGPVNDTLTGGAGQQIASFTFTGQKSADDADLRVTSLTFQTEGNGVTLSSVKLKREGSDEEATCALSSTQIICSNISSTLGSFKNGPVTLRVYGDVSISSNVTTPSLRLTLNNPGTPSSAGDISWTDGTTTFTWVPFDAPVARGTSFK